MSIDGLIDDTRDWNLLKDARAVGAVQAEHRTIERMRDKVRAENETDPMISEKIKKDFRFKAGYIAALNWVLGIPDEVQKHIEHLPNDEEIES